jgi:hypothetical protein
VASLDRPLEHSIAGQSFDRVDCLVVGTERVVGLFWDDEDCDGVFEWVHPGPQAVPAQTNPAAALTLTQPGATAETRIGCILVRSGLVVESHVPEWGSQPMCCKAIIMVDRSFFRPRI